MGHNCRKLHRSKEVITFTFTEMKFSKWLFHNKVYSYCLKDLEFYKTGINLTHEQQGIEQVLHEIF